MGVFTVSRNRGKLFQFSFFLRGASYIDGGKGRRSDNSFIVSSVYKSDNGFLSSIHSAGMDRSLWGEDAIRRWAGRRNCDFYVSKVALRFCRGLTSPYSPWGWIYGESILLTYD